MYSVVLISVLQFCISFRAAAADCYDDPMNNNRSYDNCDTCYQTLVNALINTGDNKYQLSVAFFPTNTFAPVEVEVIYMAIGDSNMTESWCWLNQGYHIIQPVGPFVYHSLFFLRPQWGSVSTTLELPDSCFSNTTKSKNMFQHLTQRVSIAYIYTKNS